jgi:hypothetical protein
LLIVHSPGFEIIRAPELPILSTPRTSSRLHTIETVQTFSANTIASLVDLVSARTSPGVLMLPVWLPSPISIMRTWPFWRSSSGGPLFRVPKVIVEFPARRT